MTSKILYYMLGLLCTTTYAKDIKNIGMAPTIPKLENFRNDLEDLEHRRNVILKDTLVAADSILDDSHKKFKDLWQLARELEEENRRLKEQLQGFGTVNLKRSPQIKKNTERKKTVTTPETILKPSKVDKSELKDWFL